MKKLPVIMKDMNNSFSTHANCLMNKKIFFRFKSFTYEVKKNKK